MIKKAFLNKLGEIRYFWKMIIFLIIFFLFYYLFLNLIPVSLLIIIDFNIVLLIVLLLSSYFCVRVLDKKTFLSIGLNFNKTTLRDLYIGIIISFCIISLIFICELIFGLISIESKTIDFGDSLSILFNGFFVYFIVAFNEEVFFRGYIFQKFIENNNHYFGIALFPIVFSFAHLNNPNINVISLINIFIAGIWFSLAYIKTLSLLVPIGMHFIWNYFQGTIYSFPVSGINSDNTLFRISQSGPTWLTGGEFGPEGGILASFFLCCGCFFFYFYDDVLTFSISKNNIQI